MSDKKSILLVEDDKYIAMALRIRLLAHGYGVIVVSRFDEALKAASESSPQVLVVDINLPDGNGIELMNVLHETYPESPIPAIVMTASKKPGLRNTSIQQGAIRFMEKPFRSSDLIQALELAFGSSSHSTVTAT